MGKKTDIHHQQQNWGQPGPPPGPHGPYPPPWAGQGPTNWGYPGESQPRAATPEGEAGDEKSQDETNRSEYRNPPDWDPRWDSGQQGGYGWWYNQPWSWANRVPWWGQAQNRSGWGASPWGWRYGQSGQGPQYAAQDPYCGNYPGYERPYAQWGYPGYERADQQWGYPGYEHSRQHGGYPSHASTAPNWQWAYRHAHRAMPEWAYGMFGPWWAGWQDPFYRHGWQGQSAQPNWWQYGPNRGWGWGAAA